MKNTLYNIWNNISEHLAKTEYTPNISEKVFYIFKMATIPAFFISIVETFSGWYIVDEKFMLIVFIAVALDHALGSIVHLFFKKDFSIKLNIKGLFIKLTGCIVGYVLFIMIHEIIKDEAFIAKYFKMVIQMMVLIYPAGSAILNLHIVTGGKIPPKWMIDRVTNFQNTGDIEQFKFNKDEKTNGIISDDSDTTYTDSDPNKL